MNLLTIIDDGGEAKLLEVEDDESAKRIHIALVENGMIVARERV